MWARGTRSPLSSSDDAGAMKRRKRLPSPHDPNPEPSATFVDCSNVLKGIRVDDWVFGVSSVSKDGFESPVASAVPGGAFKPYVAPTEPK